MDTVWEDRSLLFIMLWLLLLYGMILIVIGLLDAGRASSFGSFVLAGRNRGSLMVGGSILASVVGASATLGVADLAYQVGFPAFWWLGSGAAGLLICGFMVARKVYSLDVYTLAGLVQEMIGPSARVSVSIVVVFGWTGIVAAQFVAASRILASLSGWEYSSALVLGASCIILYSILGGQLSVLKTDALQLGILLAGLFLTLWILYSGSGLPARGLKLELLNESFGMKRFWYFFLIVGSGFVIGPDIFSRLFSARDAGTARRAAVISGLFLLLISFGIVLIGLWGRYFVELPPGASLLPWVIENEVPFWLGTLLSFGLLSAIISSSDTCLMSASAIFEHDLLGGTRVWRTRVIILALGLGALAIAGLEGDIISTLLLAYSLFNCGVIPPILVAVLAWPAGRLSQRLVIPAVLGGGVIGIAGKILDSEFITLSAMGLSLLLSLLALRGGDSAREAEPESHFFSE